MKTMHVRWICCLLLVGLVCTDGWKYDWGMAIRAIRNRLIQGSDRWLNVFARKKNRTMNLIRDLTNVVPLFRGTKWCGPGDIATDDQDLGSNFETDNCCRAHDKCPDIMVAGQSKHGLINLAPYTRMNCACDHRFLNCLHKARIKLRKRKRIADAKECENVGILYFDFLRQKCYKLEHKMIGCEGYNPMTRRCRKYVLNRRSRKTWQWFRVPFFYEPRD